MKPYAVCPEFESRNKGKASPGCGESYGDNNRGTESEPECHTALHRSCHRSFEKRRGVESEGAEGIMGMSHYGIMEFRAVDNFIISYFHNPTIPESYNNNSIGCAACGRMYVMTIT